MPEHPESFPVNALVPIPGTPLEANEVKHPQLAQLYFCLLNISTPAGAVPYFGSHNSYGSYRSTHHHNPLGGRKKYSRRTTASYVFYGGRECCFHGRADADDTL